jgi:hypothetical protein
MGHARPGWALLALMRGPDPGTRPSMEVVALPDDAGLRFHDRVALEEIELYSEVLSAVAASDRALTAAEIDEVLGLMPGAAANTRRTLSTAS